LKISAQDDTRSGLNSVLSNISSLARGAIKPITIPLQIARGGLGLLRDIQMGLLPTIRDGDQFYHQVLGSEGIAAAAKVGDDRHARECAQGSRRRR
jgi:hypothetical protein